MHLFMYVYIISRETSWGESLGGLPCRGRRKEVEEWKGVGFWKEKGKKGEEVKRSTNRVVRFTWLFHRSSP